ncbi:MAG: hypothetical protein LBN21_09245 [Treponema sp.]|nr:hypothetical protein [Treponema sp.]
MKLFKRAAPAVFFLLIGIFVFCAFQSTGTGKYAGKKYFSANEETLLRYARARELYYEGRFPETAKALGGVKKFPPALVLRGKAEYFSGDLAASEKSLRRALDLRPSSVEAQIYLARIFREQGKKEAAGIAESLIADDPANIRALRLAADLERERGADGDALALLDRAAEASAETALVYMDRAKIRWVMGKGELALEDLDRARAALPWETPLVKSIENLELVIKEALQ